MDSSQSIQFVDHLLQQRALPLGPASPCPYLPGRQSRYRAFVAESLDPQIYHALMDRGFRRSGQMFYQPNCPQCRQCVQTRVAVETFRASRSQRRNQRRNSDLRVQVGPGRMTPEKWRLFCRYQAHQHDGTMTSEPEVLEDFLYRSPVDTLEMCYRLEATLVGVSISDRAPHSLSSVYMYYDPAHAGRGLGTFSILWEIAYCRRQRIPYYYLGFYVRDCGKMAYKGNYRPQQRLGPDFEWVNISG